MSEDINVLLKEVDSERTVISFTSIARRSLEKDSRRFGY